MKLPDRWLNYEAVGQRIPNTPFVAFKTPLSEYINEAIAPSIRFTPLDASDAISSQGYDLEVVIDLTNTSKYYDGEQDFLQKQGIFYQKILCEGHKVPRPSVVNMFSNLVNDFLLVHGKDSNKVIGVHCTHGVNRTGYLVCRYLIDWLGFNPRQAIAAFDTARGYPMERHNYIESLYSRSAQRGFESLHATGIVQPPVGSNSGDTGKRRHGGGMLMGGKGREESRGRDRPKRGGGRLSGPGDKSYEQRWGQGYDYNSMYNNEPRDRQQYKGTACANNRSIRKDQQFDFVWSNGCST